MAALPMIAEEIVSEVLVVFEFFHFMWALLMEVVSMFSKLCGKTSADLFRGVVSPRSKEGVSQRTQSPL
jgi:hypothetical protein